MPSPEKKVDRPALFLLICLFHHSVVQCLKSYDSRNSHGAFIFKTIFHCSGQKGKTFRLSVFVPHTKSFFFIFWNREKKPFQTQTKTWQTEKKGAKLEDYRKKKLKNIFLSFFQIWEKSIRLQKTAIKWAGVCFVSDRWVFFLQRLAKNQRNNWNVFHVSKQTKITLASGVVFLE